jgi:DNA-directed RNA polymerase subunit RPC12/RpoP
MRGRMGDMGVHNQTTVELACPRCGVIGPVDVELHFGFGNLIELKIGDQYPFLDARKAVYNGGYPPEGNMDGTGYAECLKCGKDFWVKALIRAGVLTAVEVDNDKKPYMP